MKIEKFKVIDLVKEFNVAIDKYLINFPNKEKTLKDKIVNTAYDLLLITYKANATTNILKKLDLQEDAFALIKFLDFLINVCYEKQIINNKRYLRFGESLENILKYYTGWINSTRKEIANKPWGLL